MIIGVSSVEAARLQRKEIALLLWRASDVDVGSGEWDEAKRIFGRRFQRRKQRASVNPASQRRLGVSRTRD